MPKLGLERVVRCEHNRAKANLTVQRLPHSFVAHSHSACVYRLISIWLCHFQYTIVCIYVACKQRHYENWISGFLVGIVTAVLLPFQVRLRTVREQWLIVRQMTNTLDRYVLSQADIPRAHSGYVQQVSWNDQFTEYSSNQNTRVQQQIWTQ